MCKTNISRLATFFFAFALFLTPVVAASKISPLPSSNGLVGVNLSGAEYSGNKIPGVLFKDYIYPAESDIAYFARKGLRIIRLPFRWERVQPTLNRPLNLIELREIHKVLQFAAKYHVQVILDVHNFGQYRQKKIGEEGLPAEAFVDLWDRLAKAFKGNKAIWAYGLMNEPTGLEKGVWPKAAQAAIEAIRQHDKTTTILVPGEFWSSALKWPQVNPEFPLTDPSNNLRYEAHTYFDSDNSGQYQKSYAEEQAQPELADQRLLPFITWLKEHQVKGFVGEYGAPADEGWTRVLERALTLMHENNIPSTYWAAGAWWGNYPLSVQPAKDGTDKPQMRLLEKYAAQPAPNQ